MQLLALVEPVLAVVMPSPHGSQGLHTSKHIAQSQKKGACRGFKNLTKGNVDTMKLDWLLPQRRWHSSAGLVLMRRADYLQQVVESQMPRRAHLRL
jgi:hypothetical protein